ncbi:MAG TPA: hypothetical protein DD490_07495 [Acidobacteria bacterium]|nr:hypothetical protein [Acidobacteriota bacterium]
MTQHDVRPPDLEMRVRIAAEQGKARLRFILHSPNGKVALSHREIEGPLLQRNPEKYQGYLLSKIEKLGERLDIDRSLLLQPEIKKKLESLGHDLWRELFSSELRAVYRRVIRPAVHSWVIVSDEPWIPWELVKPYDDGEPGEPLDDDFLCLRFALTRWLVGDKPFVPEISLGRLAVVVSAPDLPHAAQERKLFNQLKETFPGLHVEAPRLDSASYVLEFLTSAAFDLVHFIGHGTPMTAHPDEAGLPFADKTALRPADLHGSAATSLGRSRPLVFLNACWAGKEGWSLTQLGGWAARWIGVCGCGAFVAPLWPVRDQAALTFAWSFYEALGHGATLGDAALAARLRVAKERPGDPSAYAYTVYGHPNARVLFDRESATHDAPGAGAQTRTRSWVQPGPRRWPRRLAAMGAALALAALAHFTTTPLADRFFAVEPAMTAPGRTVADLRPPAEKPAPAFSSSPRSSATTTVGGLQFRISGGQASLHYALKTALRRAAAPLTEQGISGWTITLELEAPRIDPVSQGELPLQSCHLTGRAEARGAATRLDLGPVHAVNAQFNATKACEAATGAIAETVLSRFAEALPQEGEP